MRPWARTLVAVVLAGCNQRSLPAVRVPLPRPDSVAVELYLIGDAGLPDRRGEPVLRALRDQIRQRAPERSFVVFLGDNVYPAGLPDSTHPYRAAAEWILREQIETVRSAGSGVRALFVPGNHDWDAGGDDGWASIRRQEGFVRKVGGDRVLFLPSNGCPGPAVVDLGVWVRIVALDTQWWLHDERKPGRGDCPAGTEAEVATQLAAALRAPGPPVRVVVAHHPLHSGGPHGGYFDWPSYVFPLVPLARRLGFVRQDIRHPVYRRMILVLEGAMAVAPPLVYAAGHEHNLQLLRGRAAAFEVVSGGGIYGHTSPVRALDSSLYARRASGFVKLSVLQDGRVRLGVWVVDARGQATEDYSRWLRSDPWPSSAPSSSSASPSRPNPASVPTP